jgi:hypothetical protein
MVYRSIYHILEHLDMFIYNIKTLLYGTNEMQSAELQLVSLIPTKLKWLLKSWKGKNTTTYSSNSSIIYTSLA